MNTETHRDRQTDMAKLSGGRVGLFSLSSVLFSQGKRASRSGLKDTGRHWALPCL